MAAEGAVAKGGGNAVNIDEKNGVYIPNERYCQELSNIKSTHDEINQWCKRLESSQKAVEDVLEQMISMGTIGKDMKNYDMNMMISMGTIGKDMKNYDMNMVDQRMMKSTQDLEEIPRLRTEKKKTIKFIVGIVLMSLVVGVRIVKRY